MEAKLTEESIQEALGRLFYQVREQREKDAWVRLHVFIAHPAAFDEVVRNMGSLALLKQAMLTGDISISASPDVLEYINQKLNDEEVTKEAEAVARTRHDLRNHREPT